MHPSLVALSASAIATVYAVGYVHTQPAEPAPELAGEIVQIAAAPTPTVEVMHEHAAPTSEIVVSVSTAVASPTAEPTAVKMPDVKYNDGTYAGAGTSRFGDVEVEVAIVGGRINQIVLTSVTTTYSPRYVAPLPAEAIRRQSPFVDLVSGASVSSQAFSEAVQRALLKAK